MHKNISRVQEIRDRIEMVGRLNSQEIENGFSKLDTGERCNAGCWFCYYRDSLGAKFKPKEKIFNDIKKLSTAGVTLFELSGGESTIHPDFFEIIEEVKKYGDFGLITNAIVGTPDFWKELITYNPKFIKFSIQGNQELHDDILNRSGSFFNIIRSINILRRNNIPIRINTVCTTETSNNFMRTLYDFCDKYAQELNIIPLNQFGDQTKEVLSTSDIEKIFMWSNDINLNDRTKIKYIPYCSLRQPQNKKNIMNYFDMVFDPEDWNPWYSKDTDSPEITPDGIIDDIFKKREALYHKTALCIGCQYSSNCDGFKGKI